MKWNPAVWMQKMGIPNDVLLNTPILEMEEFKSVHIINYTGIAELAAEQVRITAQGGEYVIEGQNLIISRATHREIEIYGELHALRFVKKEEREGR